MKTKENITEQGLESSSAKLMPKDIILMAMYGATVGAISILGISAATNQAVCCINNLKNLEKEYLVTYLKSIKSYLLSNRAGGGQPNLNQNFIKNLKIPIPPISDQKNSLKFLKKRIILKFLNLRP